MSNEPIRFAYVQFSAQLSILGNAYLCYPISNPKMAVKKAVKIGQNDLIYAAFIMISQVVVIYILMWAFYGFNQ